MKFLYLILFTCCFGLNLTLHDFDNPSASHILDVHIMDDILIVVGMVGGIEIYDISNPVLLNHLSNFNLPGNGGGGGGGGTRPNCVSSSGSIAYFTSKNGVAMVDLSNPSNPQNLGYITGTSNYELENLEIHEDILVVCAHTEGVLFYDISISTSPELITVINSENAWAVALDDGGNIAENSDFAYVADGTNIIVIEMGENGIQEINSLETGSAVKDIAVDNLFLYAALGSDGVNVYDLSGWLGGTDDSPEFLDNINTAGMANRLAVSEWKLGVADWDDVEVLEFDQQIVGYTDNSFLHVGYKNTTRRTMAIAAKDNYFYSAEWASVQVFEYGEIDSPDIDLSNYELNYPFVENGESYTLSVDVTNNGGSVLEISDAFTTNNEFMPTTIESLAPGETQSIDVTYTAGNVNASGGLRIWSNDPDEPDITCETNGNIDGANIGEPAPDFELNIVANGTGTYQLSDHFGEVIVLAFFSPM